MGCAYAGAWTEAAALATDVRNRLPGGRAVMLGFGSLSERQLESRVAEFAARLQADSPGAVLAAAD